MWRQNLKDWKNVDIEIYKFCFVQAEKRLNDLMGQSEKITSNTHSLIKYVIALLSVSIGVLYNSISVTDKVNIYILLSVCNCIALGICLYQLYTIVKPRLLYFSGTEPKKILISDFVEIESLNNDQNLQYLYLSEIEVIQDKIEQTGIANTERVILLGKCMNVLLFLSIIAIGSITVHAMSVFNF